MASRATLIAGRFLPLLVMLTTVACSSDPGPGTGVSDVACIGRLYGFPYREETFPAAATLCARHGPLDLTNARFYQKLASTYNIPYVAHDAPGTDQFTVTGSRIAEPASEPAPPELHIN